MNSLARYFRNIFDGVGTTLAGMQVTMQWLRSPDTTLQYPRQRMPMFERFRGLLHNRIEDCIGCGACSRACPVDCITMVTQKSPKSVDLGLTRDGTEKKLYVFEYEIDTLTCMWCGLCTEVCPTHCLTMSSEYEVASYDRQDWQLSFAVDEVPADFDMDAARDKLNRVTNPVDFAGDPDASHLELPAGAVRPETGAGVFDFQAHVKAEVAKVAAARKAAAKAEKEKAAAEKAAAEQAAAEKAGTAEPAAGEPAGEKQAGDKPTAASAPETPADEQPPESGVDGGTP